VAEVVGLEVDEDVLAGPTRDGIGTRRLPLRCAAPLQTVQESWLSCHPASQNRHPRAGRSSVHTLKIADETVM
jgi:hypothetical protein